MFSVKGLVESGVSPGTVPSNYVFPKSCDDDCLLSEAAEAIPTIDFCLLTSDSPKQRSEIVQALGNACSEWGFFMLTNHGVPKTLRDEMVRVSEGFFDLPDVEKQEYAGNKVSDPIKWGTSFNVKVDKTFLWRDYLKVHVHPQFNAPQKPPGFSETAQEYCKRCRELAGELLKGISESLGLEESYIGKTMDIESGPHQTLVVNLYPPCPQPEDVMGLPPHSDHGLLTILMQNELCGLQIQHGGKWIPINPPPNALIVNVGDHMEILTNGKYKSVLHRAVVNGKATRISIGIAHGPQLDSVVSPAPELLAKENKPAAYRGITYRNYLELQQSSHLDGKSCLCRVRI